MCRQPAEEHTHGLSPNSTCEPAVTAAGKQQAAAAATIPPAAEAYARACQSSRATAKARHFEAAAGQAQYIVQDLAWAINYAGYAAKKRWEAEFSGLPVDAADPDQICSLMHQAARQVTEAANGLRDYRHMDRTEEFERPSRQHITAIRGNTLRDAIDDYVKSARAGGYAQVPDHVGVIVCLHKALADVRQALQFIAAALQGWAAASDTDYDGVIEALTAAAHHCRIARATMAPVVTMTGDDVKTWNSPARRRAAAALAAAAKNQDPRACLTAAPLSVADSGRDTGTAFTAMNETYSVELLQNGYASVEHNSGIVTLVDPRDGSIRSGIGKIPPALIREITHRWGSASA